MPGPVRLARPCALALAAGALLALPAGAAGAQGAGARAASLVNPFIGTDAGAADFGTGGGAGNTFPGASRPFGMAQFSPDTLPGTTNFAAGYTFSDTRTRGFSLTHFSGAGCAAFQDLPLLPTTRPVDGSPVRAGSSDLEPRFVPSLSHRAERAAPGDYRVTLDPGTPRAIGGELTATTRAAAGRFTFPAGRPGSVLLNAGGSAMANFLADVRIDPARREITATSESGNFCFQPARYRVHVVARFDRPFAAWGTWRRQALRPGSRAARDASPNAFNYKPVPGGPPALPGNPSTTAQAGAYVTFARGSGPVVVRAGVSFTSAAGARRNLEAEAAGRPFGALRAAARRAWERALGRIAVEGGRRADRVVFHSAHYRALLTPNTFSDADGRYRGMDGRVHRARGWVKYANVSGWDVYRTHVPLLAMLEPRRASDLVRSLLADARESGCLPRWPYASGQTNVMTGDPSAPMIAAAHALGARGFDAREALRRLVRGADAPCRTQNGDYTQREGLAGYLRLGYLPIESSVDGTAHTTTARDRPWGSSATTLEYALADAAIARLATALGERATARRLLRRGRWWRGVFDPRARLAAARTRAGAFPARPDPAAEEGFVEGNAAQYTFMVPHDAGGLVRALGGRAAAARRLDAFFSRLNAGPSEPYAFLGNEPSLGAPWLYAWAGRPWRTQAVVRRALLGLYGTGPGGMPGNDDGGTLSAWWLLSALGLYPADPGRDTLALAGPLFPRVTVRLPGGRLVLEAPRAARSRPYVRGVRLDGRAVRRPWLRFAALRRGGHLRFALSARPDRRWGAAPGDAPPSLTR